MSTQITILPSPPYNVYTALLTQSGANNVLYINSSRTSLLEVGVTYTITLNDRTADFTNVGAPNNQIGTLFVATGEEPKSWGTPGKNQISYNTGAPVVTVLENTIGNIWFEYLDVGSYYMKSNRLFGNVFPVIINNIDLFDVGSSISQTLQVLDTDTILIRTSDVNALSDDFLVNTPIEIRVYN